MKLQDLLVANALIKLGPFVVGGVLLFGAFACNSLSTKVGGLTESVAPTPSPEKVVREVSNDDLVKARCLKGEFNARWWGTSDCETLTGMSYTDFEIWYDRNN
jgi:hypothetical protein